MPPPPHESPPCTTAENLDPHHIPALDARCLRINKISTNFPNPRNSLRSREFFSLNSDVPGRDSRIRKPWVGSFFYIFPPYRVGIGEFWEDGVKPGVSRNGLQGCFVRSR